MGATGQPYSDAAANAAWGVYFETPPSVDKYRRLLDAAHDREVLGLDASAHAASYRREVIDDVVEFLDGLCTQYADRAARAILREFEATEAKP